jgi:hypothetical protein
VILPKVQKKTYIVPKAFRIISLLNYLGKVLEKVYAIRLAYLANTAGLLHPTQLGGRKQRSATDAVMLLLQYIQQQKNTRKNNITSTVFLDIKGAFDAVLP